MSHPQTRPPVDDTDVAVRNRRMLLVGAVMATLAFVVAAGYWYTHEPGKAPAPPTLLSIKQVDGDLVLGPSTARHHLVIDETFSCSRCASFEVASEAFLRADAAAGLVQVRYVIPPASNAEYTAMLAKDPTRALAVKDDLFNGSAGAGSGDSLRVVLDGKTLPQHDPIDLANALESALAG